MEIKDIQHFKIVVFIPEEYLKELMDSINETKTFIHKKYDYVFNTSKTQGTWRPLKGATPYLGEINKINKKEEIRLEFTVSKKDLKSVLLTILKNHPYEKPVIDIYPIATYIDFLKENELK